MPKVWRKRVRLLARRRSGQAKVGLARASVLTPEERREIAQGAVRARWMKAGKARELIAPDRASITSAGPAGDTARQLVVATQAEGRGLAQCRGMGRDGGRLRVAGCRRWPESPGRVRSSRRRDARRGPGPRPRPRPRRSPVRPPTSGQVRAGGPRSWPLRQCGCTRCRAAQRTR